jgi:uncharacterized iron-regulated membrane protein
MKFPLLNRKVHYWLSAFVALPMLVIIGSGILLQLKKQISWVQPPEQRGVGKEPALSFPQILERCRGVSQAQIRDWPDVKRLDIRPARGVLKVWAKSNWEIQLDSKTGEVLQVAYRRSDLIESIHDGSWFHERAKLWLFLPAGVALLVLWVTGIFLFIWPYLLSYRRTHRPSRA